MVTFFHKFYSLFSQIFRMPLHWSRRYFGEATESPVLHSLVHCYNCVLRMRVRRFEA